MGFERPPMGSITSLPASAIEAVGDISFINPRVVSVTCRVTYNAEAIAPVRVRLFFSPTGRYYDTVDFTYFDVNLTAGQTVQETQLIDVPAEGYLTVKVENLDAVYAATNLAVYSTLQEWGEKK